MTNLKNFGSRTLVGNWWEERITLTAHTEKRDGGSVRTRDMDVDTHVKAYEVCPKWLMDASSIKTSAYTDDTNPERLEQQNRLKRKIQTADKRRRLDGTRAVAQAGMPGGTMTPGMLSREFHDPHKQRMKTVYTKTFGNRPMTTQTRGIGGGGNTGPQSTVRPRMGITDSSWVPGWGQRK